MLNRRKNTRFLKKYLTRLQNREMTERTEDVRSCWSLILRDIHQYCGVMRALCTLPPVDVYGSVGSWEGRMVVVRQLAGRRRKMKSGEVLRYTKSRQSGHNAPAICIHYVTRDHKTNIEHMMIVVLGVNCLIGSGGKEIKRSTEW